jgi:rod shape-determining protein MreC
VKFFQKKTVVLTVAVVTVFLLASSAAQGKYKPIFLKRAVETILAPVQYVISQAGFGVLKMDNFTRGLMNVYQDNQNLRAENQTLKQNNLNVAEIMAENIRLRKMLDYKKTATQFDFVTAAVVGRDPGSWTSSIMIDCGSDSGIAKDMTVVTPQGLVGSVVSVYPKVSRVQLILDPRSAVGALVQRPESRVAAIVEGNGANPLMPHMVNIARDADIIKGDQIITSGFGGIYPKGLLIGEVTDIVNDEGGLLKYAVIKPAVDFDKLEEVMVIVRSREPIPVLPSPSAAADKKTAKPGKLGQGTGR